MLGLKKQLSVKSIIGPGMQVNGPVTFQDGLQIDGTVLGEVRAAADQPSLLVITETGTVHGAISADHVVIGGAVNGPVRAGELLELQAKARVEGDVQYKALEMQQGAIIAGQLRPQLTPRATGGGPTEPALEPLSVLQDPAFADSDLTPFVKRDTRLF
ncbi:MAG: polymer-forming cytoskeletal protein [Burkholderiaceae bacterium]|jgi:cytoskeletal protein CcmA (bactofilin family)|nr:polymer-forming cytoskeletal protein [Burkholderiaceae bacterium]